MINEEVNDLWGEFAGMSNEEIAESVPLLSEESLIRLAFWDASYVSKHSKTEYPYRDEDWFWVLPSNEYSVIESSARNYTRTEMVEAAVNSVIGTLKARVCDNLNKMGKRVGVHVTYSHSGPDLFTVFERYSENTERVGEDFTAAEMEQYLTGLLEAQTNSET